MFRWFLSLAIPVFLLGSTPTRPLQQEPLPMPDCSQAAHTQLEGGIDKLGETLASPDLFESYAWVLLNADGCLTTQPDTKLTASAPRLQEMSLRRIWSGASRALRANAARVPGSAQRLEAHNLTVEAMHGYAALPIPLPLDSAAAAALMTRLERSLALDPELATARWLQARLEAEQGRHEAAISDFRLALDLPLHPLDTGLSLATSLLETGQRQEALYTYEELMAEAKALIDSHVDFSLTPAKLANFGLKAHDALATLAAAHLGRGDIHQSYGRCDLAKPDYESACKLGLAAACERVCED